MIVISIVRGRRYGPAGRQGITGDGAGGLYRSSGAVIAGWAHEYDRLGNKEYSEDLVLTTTDDELYGYDDVYRLTSFERGALNANKDDITSPDHVQTWDLDQLGNWDETEVDSVTETRTHNPARERRERTGREPRGRVPKGRNAPPLRGGRNDVNELTARTIGEDPQISLSYDDAGNLSQDGSADGDHKYTYDYRNRLIEVEEYQTDTWNTTAEYKYDAQSRRILKVVTNSGDLNGTTRFLWGGKSDWQCLEERDSSGDLVARYTYSPGYIDAVAVQERDLNADDDFGDSNEVVYYHQNTLFSVYALTDASETVAERYCYDAYGACTVLDANGSADADGLSDVDNPYVFTGRRVDLESDLMQYRNRSYSQFLGRFTSRDAYGQRPSQPLYLAFDARPGVLSDPEGLTSKNPCKSEWDCLCCMVYAEARGTPPACQHAVTWVLVNRAHRRKKSLCYIVAEGDGKQFNGYKTKNFKDCCKEDVCENDKPDYDDSWLYCQGDWPLIYDASDDPTGGAEWFHDKSIDTPGWIKERIRQGTMEEVTVEGGCTKFRFYRMKDPNKRAKHGDE